MPDGTAGAFAAVAGRDEFHGETRLLALDCSSQNWLASIPASVKIHEGERLWVAFDQAATHLFDTVTGLRLPH